MGQLDGFNRNSIKDFLVEISGIQGRMIFNVDVKNSFSFFETENKYMDKFLALNKDGIEFNARAISFEVSKAKSSGGGYGEKRSYGGGSREDRGRSSFGGGERRSYGGNREGGERRSYGGNREGGERKSYGGGENRSYSGGGERRSSFGGNREGGERKSYGGGEKRSFDKTGNEKSFSGNRENAERRKRFTK